VRLGAVTGPAVYIALVLMSGRSTLSSLGLAGPGSETYLAAVGLVWVLVLAAARSRLAPWPLDAGLAFTVGLALVTLVGTTYSPLPDLALSKATLVGLATLTVVLARAALREPEDYGRLAGGFFAAAVVLAALALVTGPGAQSRLAALWGGPNVFARFMFLGGASALYLWRTARRGARWLLLGPGLVLLAVCLVLAGSRGALVSALAACLATLVLFSRRRLSTILRVAAVLGLVGLVLAFVPVPETLWERYSSLVEEQADLATVAARLDLYRIALDAFLDSLWVGYGTAAFAAFSPYRSFRYPHNLFLEVACEQGLVGLSVLAVMLGTGLGRLVRPRPGTAAAGDPGLRAYVFACLTFFLTAAQFSGDLYDSRFVLFFAALGGGAWPGASCARTSGDVACRPASPTAA